jgi:hypothetical protein
MTPDRTKVVAEARQEAVRNAGTAGLYKHFLPAAETDKLHDVWAKTIAYCGLPPNILENDYFRDAVLQTSLSAAPYTAPRRNQMERKLLPKYDEALDNLVKGTMRSVRCRVLGFDGWDDAQRRPLINFLLMSESGDEFIDSELMAGKDKTAEALAKLAFKYIQWAHRRYPPAEGLPTVFGLCSDNPTAMRRRLATADHDPRGAGAEPEVLLPLAVPLARALVSARRHLQAALHQEDPREAQEDRDSLPEQQPVAAPPAIRRAGQPQGPVPGRPQALPPADGQALRQDAHRHPPALR